MLDPRCVAIIPKLTLGLNINSFGISSELKHANLPVCVLLLFITKHQHLVGERRGYNLLFTLM